VTLNSNSTGRVLLTRGGGPDSFRGFHRNSL